MTRTQLKRSVKRFFATNKAIDGKTAEIIVQGVLADGLVSRTEKRFLSGLLKREKLDNAAQLMLHRVLAKGS